VQPAAGQGNNEHLACIQAAPTQVFWDDLVGLSDVSDQQLAFWIEQRYLDTATTKLLRKFVDLRQQAAGIEAQIARLEKERDGIYYSQEDRLEAIERELRQGHDGRDKCREEIAGLSAGLEYEAKV
jgi:hypothetical protein